MDTPAKEQKIIATTSAEIEPLGRPVEQERPVETAAADSSELVPAQPAPDSDLLVGSHQAITPIPATAKSQLEKEIEDVLAEDLDSLYWELSESERLVFKQKGEETASLIRLLLGEANIRVQEIFRLIVEWLKLLPGISQFFVEQEAKIKTDKLLKFH